MTHERAAPSVTRDLTCGALLNPSRALAWKEGASPPFFWASPSENSEPSLMWLVLDNTTARPWPEEQEEGRWMGGVVAGSSPVAALSPSGPVVMGWGLLGGRAGRATGMLGLWGCHGTPTARSAACHSTHGYEAWLSSLLQPRSI